MKPGVPFRRRRRVPTALLGLVLLTGGCSLVSRPVPLSGPLPPPPVAGAVEEGIASWYGPPFHGRQTASGEIYDMEAPTAAHRTLPFGTRVRVYNLDSGRSTELRINDRGPFVRGRIIDVSRRGARELGLLGPGIAPVLVEILDMPASPSCFEIQAGAFRERENAETLRSRLEVDGLPARTLAGPDGVMRVRVGPFASQDEARRVEARTEGLLLGC